MHLCLKQEVCLSNSRKFVFNPEVGINVEGSVRREGGVGNGLAGLGLSILNILRIIEALKIKF